MCSRLLFNKSTFNNHNIYQKFIKISIRFHRKHIRSNNEVLKALALATEFKLKHKMEESIKPKRKDKYLGRSVMLALPSTIKEAELIVNTYLEHNLFVLFSDSTCPFSYHTIQFLDTLDIKYENIPLDGFGNKQLIQNYLQQLCNNNVAARCPPVAFIKNIIETNNIYLIGADGIANAWQTETLHEFYPHLISPNENNEKYLNGEWDINEWKLLTQIQGNMASSFGYKPTYMSASLSAHEPHPKKINKWSQFVGMPILAKDIGNPQRPTD
eukprot:472969_1